MNEIIDTISMCWVFALLLSAAVISITIVTTSIYVIIRLIIIKIKKRKRELKNGDKANSKNS